MTGPRHHGLRPSHGWLLLALAAMAAVPVLLWVATPDAPAPVAAVKPTVTLPAPQVAPALPVAAASASAAMASAPARAQPVAFIAARPVRDPGGDQTPDLTDYLNPGERPTMNEVIARLHAAGVTSGLGAFQPPGTRPPLVGLAVPDDFVLPEGYVRHHQATDDGQRIEAILMFSPFHRWVDGNGQPLALPAHRVVPPEWAPPGLPLRQIVVPAPVEPGR